MTGNNLLDEIDGLLNEIESTKAAEASSSQGKIQNQGDTGTSHPSKNEDDSTQDASEGSRSSENSSDVKSNVPSSVDDTKEDKMDGASEDKMTTAKPTGEDPSNETSSADGLIGGDAGKDHQGKDTAHPAKVDFGGKYASVRDLLPKGRVKEAAATLQRRINDFNASVAALAIPTEDKTTKEAANNDSKSNKPAGGQKKEAGNKCSECGAMYDSESCPCLSKKASDNDADEAAGRKAAKVAAAELGIVGNTDQQINLVNEVIKNAVDDANMYADFMDDFARGAADAAKEKSTKQASKANPQVTALVNALKKKAAEECKSGKKPKSNNAKKAMEDGAAGADMMAGGGEGEAPGTPGEGAGAGDEGAFPPEAGGGGGDQSQLVEQILAELQAAGIDPAMLAEIDPQELIAALTQGAGGGMGEPGPEGAMVSPEEMSGGVEPPMGAAPELSPAPV